MLSFGKTCRGEPVLLTERWLMAYYAGVGDTHPRNFDDRDPIERPITAHPIFYWALSWPFLKERLGHELFEEPRPPLSVLQAGVHVGEEMTSYRQLQAGDSVYFTCCLYAARQRRRGAVVGVRFDFYRTSDEEKVLTQWVSIFFIGLRLREKDRRHDSSLAPPPSPIAHSDTLQVAAPTGARGHVVLNIGVLDAHVYSECARIFNPIHTSRRIAEAAGLGHVLLHGTCVLAKCVTAILDNFACQCGSAHRSRPCLRCARRVRRGMSARCFVPSCKSTMPAHVFVSLTRSVELCFFLRRYPQLVVRCGGLLSPVLMPSVLILRSWVSAARSCASSVCPQPRMSCDHLIVIGVIHAVAVRKPEPQGHLL